MNDPRPGPPARPPAGLPSAFGCLPEDFEALGCPARPLHVFGQLQRVWAWPDGRPRLARTTWDWLQAHLDKELPVLTAAVPSEDGSTKYTLRLADGECIEAVHMPRELRNPRVTLCLSSQVGCAMGCRFCATAGLGLRRNLEAGEIVGQVLALIRRHSQDRPHRLNLVFMGMGEPLHNLEAVHRAIRILHHPQGLNLSARRITVSTSGLVPGMQRLAALEPRPWLALSLNATTDALRDRLMPVNRTWNLASLREAFGAWPLHPGEKLVLEYVLLAGVNDGPEDARRLADWAGDRRDAVNVNLIRFNPHEGCAYADPEDPAVESFAQSLKAEGCFVTVRRSRGRDAEGACGQLAQRTPP